MGLHQYVLETEEKVMLELYHFFIIATIALVIGSISVIAGFGGGVFLVPILAMFFPLEIYEIVGSVLLTLFIPALIGSIEAIRKKEVDFIVALVFSIPAGLGSFAGAYFSEALNSFQVKLIISILALVLSISMFIKVLKVKFSGDTAVLGQKMWGKIAAIPPIIVARKGRYDYKISIPVFVIFGFLVGGLSGLLGISGGWIQSPLFILGFGIPAPIATGTSLLIVIVKSLIGGATHITEGHINWWLFLTLGVSMPIGAVIGNMIKARMQDDHISLFIAFSLLIVAVIITLYLLITQV